MRVGSRLPLGVSVSQVGEFGGPVFRPGRGGGPLARGDEERFAMRNPGNRLVPGLFPAPEMG